MFFLFLKTLKTFGLVLGQRVAVLIDSSNSNMGFGRAIELQDSLIVKKLNKICKIRLHFRSNNLNCFILVAYKRAIIQKEAAIHGLVRLQYS